MRHLPADIIPKRWFVKVQLHLKYEEFCACFPHKTRVVRRAAAHMRIGRTDCNHYNMRSERLWKLLCVFCTLRPNPDTLKMLYQIFAIKYPGLRASMARTEKPCIY